MGGDFPPQNFTPGNNNGLNINFSGQNPSGFINPQGNFMGNQGFGDNQPGNNRSRYIEAPFGRDEYALQLPAIKAYLSNPNQVHRITATAWDRTNYEGIDIIYLLSWMNHLYSHHDKITLQTLGTDTFPAHLAFLASVATTRGTKFQKILSKSSAAFCTDLRNLMTLYSIRETASAGKKSVTLFRIAAAVPSIPINLYTYYRLSGPVTLPSNLEGFPHAMRTVCFFGCILRGSVSVRYLPIRGDGGEFLNWMPLDSTYPTNPPPATPTSSTAPAPLIRSPKILAMTSNTESIMDSTPDLVGEEAEGSCLIPQMITGFQIQRVAVSIPDMKLLARAAYAYVLKVDRLINTSTWARDTKLAQISRNIYNNPSVGEEARLGLLQLANLVIFDQTGIRINPSLVPLLQEMIESEPGASTFTF